MEMRLRELSKEIKKPKKSEVIIWRSQDKGSSVHAFFCSSEEEEKLLGGRGQRVGA